MLKKVHQKIFKKSSFKQTKTSGILFADATSLYLNWPLYIALLRWGEVKMANVEFLPFIF